MIYKRNPLENQQFTCLRFLGNIFPTKKRHQNITSESSHCFRKGNRNSGRRLCIMVCPSFWEDYYMLIYTHCWELMNSVGSHGSLSPLFMMKVMVCHFVSDSPEVMTALIVMLLLILLWRFLCNFINHLSSLCSMYVPRIYVSVG
jgi:hypothetical protein